MMASHDFPEVDIEFGGRPPAVFSENGYGIQQISCLSLEGAIDGRSSSKLFPGSC